MARTNPTIYAAALLLVASITGLAIAATTSNPIPVSKGKVAERVKGAEPFRSDFSALDKSLWRVSHGWTNGKYMVNDWQKTQVTAGGNLTLTLDRAVTSKHPYSSGEVQSRAVYGHGYFETTMRAAAGSGVVVGFFTYTGPPFGKPWNEIDVEILGAKPNEVLLTYFYHGKKISYPYPVDFDTTAGFHTYGFDWQPGMIEWYIDGTPVHKVTGEDLPLPNEAQKIMVHLWGSKTLTGWLGPFDANAIPSSAAFSCIGYSKSASWHMPCSAPAQ